MKSRIRSGAAPVHGSARRRRTRGRHMIHDKVEELLGAYALHTTEPNERRDIAVHLAECSRCRAEVSSHDEMVAMLASPAPEAPLGCGRVSPVDFPRNSCLRVPSPPLSPLSPPLSPLSPPVRFGQFAGQFAQFAGHSRAGLAIPGAEPATPLGS